ncbi:3D-(3,5/4)-trihydroxycyclohexane-1,2-dione acylhydrolase (decyclizing) [Geodermatophilus sp. TF02-6]|uniref:3D-(3,5/4)-trihydroxycyclohexane-1,2-dione acylhydrolase (decyclizing) n=1 Tax=Geodermatophilus sp. TF02-6 TaxID=2250575 RepID=UPI000DEAD5F6|nr:3D-(3,5/4)-trihydroxycyclohexane-1,2-dione acylhydrolase (decyclizing) [Geodermatophilus sp. TF02-6]RBY83604.1 3D-(3,5/4)-trihydroxycyclohexane-1,2-dione acylhydrolase (decyclizing) [Geodermatophilus sp. TF02-6]
MSEYPPPAAPETVRLTVSQAVVRFLAAQYTERDGQRQRLFAGCLGIFGHGNVAGLGQALLQAELEDPGALPYVLGRNEQAMVHTAVAYARTKDRLQTWAVSTSIGPGSTNMVTGAALATVNRLPVLLLPADTFATRSAGALLQELERPDSGDVSVNDAFRPVSRYFDRVHRPEELPGALLSAMRVLTDPAETGAVTVCLPQDVQAEAFDWPVELFAERTWHVARPVPEPAALARAVEVIRSARRPLVVAGGGVIYSHATEALDAFVSATGIPVGQTQAGKGALAYDHPQSVGAIGSTGTTAANALARQADVVIGIGTRYQDFTTASRTAFNDPDVRFVNVNVAAMDAVKHAGVMVQADARETLTALTDALAGWSVDDAHRQRTAELRDAWEATVEAAYHPEVPSAGEGGLTQNEVIGIVNAVSAPRDVVVCAAGSMPGDLHKMWRVRDPKGYHVEYGYSCMGYEIPGGIGIRMAAPDRDVFVMIGDGSYLMMPTELVTAVQEGVKIVVVLVQNHGFASIGALSEMLGSQRFGTRYRYRAANGRLEGDVLPVDLAANAASLGVDVLVAQDGPSFEAALRKAKAGDRTTVVHVETDPLVDAPSSESWWDVPVGEVSTLESTQEARAVYDRWKAVQRPFLNPSQP